jgi:hypothetical protein
MFWTPIYISCLCLLTAASQPELKIENIQASYGAIWPERKALVYYLPLDDISFRFLIKGLLRDRTENTIDAEIVTELRDVKDNLARLETTPWKHTVCYGGDSFIGQGVMELRDSPLPPGAYSFSVTVKDRRSLRMCNFRRGIVLKGDEWGVGRAGFFSDAGHSHQTPLSGVPGETKHFWLTVTGFDREQVNCVATVQILDQNRCPVDKPFEFTIANNDAQDLRRRRAIDVHGKLPTFTRPGDFMLLITVVDKARERVAKFEAPFHVSLW